MQESDAILLRRFVEDHDQESFTELVRRNMDAVYSAALRRVGGDAHLARDVTQDVFVILARRAESLTEVRVLAGWLHTATRNAAANRVRGEIRRRQREQEAQMMQEVIHGEEREVEWAEVAPLLDRVIDELGEKERFALLLRFFDRRSLAEVGRSLGISEDAARMRVDRALGKLRTRLGQIGIRSSVVALGVALTQHAVAAAPPGLLASAAGAALVAPSGGWFDSVSTFRPTEWGLKAATLSTIVVATATLLLTGRAAGLAETARAREQSAHVQAEARLAALNAQAAEQDQRNLVLGKLIEDAQARDVVGGQSVVAAGRRPVAEARGVSRSAGGRRALLAATYEELYRSLGLTPAQIAQFEDVCVRGPGGAIWEFDRPALDGAPRPRPLSPSEVEGQVRALLGETGYDRYREYKRILPARTAAVQLASAVYLTEPLSQEQAGQLTDLLASASNAFGAGGVVDLARLDWETVLAVAPTVLSPAQVAALGQVRQQVVLQDALLRRLDEQDSTARVSPP